MRHSRDAAARTFDHLFTRDVARDPNERATFAAQRVPEWTMGDEIVGKAITGLDKAAGPGLIEKARSIPTSTVRSVRSSSQSMRSSRRSGSWDFPELADPVGAVEVGDHQDVEQPGARSWTEGVRPLQ